MRRLVFLSWWFFACLGVAWANPLAGSWRLIPDRSTNLGAWGSLALDIKVEGNVVTIARHFAAGRRTFDDVTPVDLTKPVNIVPVSWWPDNRHIGAFIGGDQTEKVRGEWLSDGRVLRLDTDLVLATQQGEHPVNILREFMVSANGKQLTVITIRSTRNRPVVYVFKRVIPGETADTGTAE